MSPEELSSSHPLEASDREEPKKVIGARLPRIEDRPLIRGLGRFAADVSFPHQLHMRVVRSRYASAKLISINIEAAKRTPGVFTVWTSEDIPELPPIDLRDGHNEILAPYRQPVLAKGRLRYVGEPIAVVFADDEYLAEDAAELILVDAEELPVHLSASDAPVEFDIGRTTEPTVLCKSYGNVESAFKSAHCVVELDLSIGRHTGVPLETRGAIARYDAGQDLLELHGAAKVPHRNRDLVSRWLGRSPNSTHFYEGHVGGGFGVRGELYPEDLLVCVAAMRLGRPVKWIEDRREHLVATSHSRQQRHIVRAAVDKDGRVIAIDDEFFHDQGAYVRTHGARVVDMTIGTLPGPYRLPAYRAVGHYRLTNKTPAATYRSPGRYESTFIRERLFDAIAAKLGIDRIELRRRNLIAKHEMPFKRPLEMLGEQVFYDSGDYELLLDKALTAFNFEKLSVELQQRRAAGETVGVGLSMAVEESGFGPTDGVRVTVDTTGAVEVVTGSASVGQGVETVIAQICADSLGVDYQRIRVIHGRTDRIQYGIGAHASRATVMTGSATRVAAEAVRAKAIDLAAELMQARAVDLQIIDGRVVHKNSSTGASISLGEIAANLSPASPHLRGREPGLTAEGWFRTDYMNYAYAVHICVINIDRHTGQAKIERYLIAFDVGCAVNPMLVEGQITGGFAQGMGGALFEEFLYDDRGEPLCVTFADYLLPTAQDVPAIDVLITEDAPSPRNPLGIKGAGEAGVTGVGAAIAAAIDDAVGIPGAVTQLPVTPQRMKVLLAGTA